MTSVGSTLSARPPSRRAVLLVATWVEHPSLTALSTSIILHVAIGRRWPFSAGDIS